jgi:hypothetical protein
MIPSLEAESRVEGVVLQNLGREQMNVFDYFEGSEYTRRHVTISYQGYLQEAQTYVWSNPISELNLDKEWEYQQFRNESLEWYLTTTVRPCRIEMDDLGIGKV